MTSRRFVTFVLGAGLLVFLPLVRAAELSPAQRGEKALQEKAFTPAAWSLKSYQTVWRQWDATATQPPERYDETFRERYGLHPAPYANNGLPMGLRHGPSLFGKGLTTDCMICHGGSILGKSYVGLGNSTLEIQAFFEEMMAADGITYRTPFRFGNVRGTSEAGGMAVYLLGFREPDLSLRKSALHFPLRDDLCEDPPAWWLLKKKKTMYHTGGADARSVRSVMQFMMSPLNPPQAFAREEKTFADIQAYLLSLEAPRYPYPIDPSRAAKGEQLFGVHCVKCHGTYGAQGTYPNKIVPLDQIGTDSTRYHGISEETARYYNTTWFAQEKAGWFVNEYKAKHSDGYQAPPLDGVWATAPYFHNGSVPTIYGVLNSKARPKIYTRSFRTGAEDYDAVKLGWKVRELPRGPDPQLPAIERRRVYDTTQPGRGNGGHTFGDALTEEERLAVIEYLKTL